MDEIILLKLTFVAATIIIAVPLIIALLSLKKGNKKANILLATIVIINTMSCLNSLLMYTGAYKYTPTLIIASYPFVFIIGALYFFYIQQLLPNQFTFKWFHLFHLIPLFWGINEVKWFFPFSFDQKVTVLGQMWFGGYHIQWNDFIILSIPNLITIIYLLICVMDIIQTTTKLKMNFSNTDIEHLSWLKKLTITYLALISIDFLRLVFTVVFKWDPGQGEIITNLLISILVQYYIYQTIKNPKRVFYKIALPKKTSKLLNTLKTPTTASNLIQDQDFAKKLHLFMENENPYLNSELKTHELATMLDVTPHYLSKIINQEFKVNFYNFINKYRVEEFKKRAIQKENKNLTLTAIAQEVGFNSKSSFNRIFKTVTSTTPSEFIKKHQ